jgi:OOP family OmpA-OmpF porin
MLKKIVATAALAVMAASSFAGTAGTLYGGLDVGSTKVDDMPGKETSFGGFVGYNFHQNFALEAGFRRLASYNIPRYCAAVTTPCEDMTLDLDQIALSVLGSVPLGQGFSVFGRLGYNRLKADSDVGSSSDSGTLYGVGLSYNFSEKVAARVEVQKPSSDSTNVSVGVAFQF